MNRDRNSTLSLFVLVIDRWKLSLAAVALCIGLAGLCFVVAPRQYESGMKLLVKNERADLVVTPGDSPTDAERSDVNETEVNSEMELLRSHDILAAVARDAKLYRRFTRVDNAPPTSLTLEEAVQKLRRTLNVSSIRKTDIISVSYRAPDPDLAASVLKDLEARYLTAHLKVHSTPGSYKFFAEEAAKYRDQLALAQTALSDFHRKTQIFSMPLQTTALVGRLEDTKAQVKDVDAQIRESEARLQENQRLTETTPDRLVTQIREVANPLGVQQLKTMLTDLQNRRIALITKFQPSERSVIELDKEIENTQEALADMQTRKMSERTTDVNAIHQSLEAERTKAEIDLQGLKSRREDLTRSVGHYLGRLDGLDQNASRLQELEEAEKQVEDNHVLYTKRLEEARMAEALDREKFANIAVIETPVSSPIPVSPKLSLVLGVGAALGIFVALLLSLLLGSDKRNLPPKTFLARTFAESPIFSAHSGD